MEIMDAGAVTLAAVVGGVGFLTLCVLVLWASLRVARDDIAVAPRCATKALRGRGRSLG
jgi:hypothetical protein